MPAYHFFSPLLAPSQAWSAFEWQTSPAAGNELPVVAAASDRIAPLAKLLPLWIHCHPDWLTLPGFREFIQKLGRDQTILAFPPGTSAKKEHEAACQRLRKEGNHLALEVTDTSVLRALSVASFDYLAFDAVHARNKVPLIDLINAHQQGYQMVATGVADGEMFDWAVAKRFALFGSHFLLAADAQARSDADTTRIKLLKLLSLVVQDADTREIEEIFRQEPKLSYNLLRLVNSVAVGPRTPITGFNQAITVLGRRQLQRWLQLLIYANQYGQPGQPNPLMQLAATRGRQMELLAATMPPIEGVDDVGEAAFMTGVFSLLDTLLHMPMPEILTTVPLAAPINAALAERSGALGELLSAIMDADAGDRERAAGTFARLGVVPETHLEAQVAALIWATRIAIE